MRVGLIARFLGEPIGLGTYAVNLLQALDRAEDDNDYFVYTPSFTQAPHLGSRFRIRRSPAIRGSRAALTVWDMTLPAMAATRERLDVVHYLHTAYPLRSPGCPVAIDILDAIRWMVPGYREPQPYDWLERRAASRADLILTLSEHAREDLQAALDIPPSKLRVTPLGGPPLDPEPAAKEPYFLFMGGTEKRKNLTAALDAFVGIEGYELRVVGRHTASPVHNAKREQPGVRWLGFVDEDELVELYRHATALVFPSRYEGFGLPLLEAMARHTPVIAANTSSIPEVTRDAAILVDPDDVGGLREAMLRVASDARLREDLTKRGAETLASFSWDETARTTLAAYAELATGG